MMIKRNFVKEAVEDGELIVLACDTKDMPANQAATAGYDEEAHGEDGNGESGRVSWKIG